jgi:hypothetical protein
MGYADELLAKDEVILRRDRQHWILPFQIAGRWVGIAVLVTVVSLFLDLVVFKPGGTGILGSISSFIGTLLGWVTLLALLVAVVGFAWSVAVWKTQEYVLTNQRVMHIRGLVNKQASDSSLESLSDARIEVPVLGRALGFGDLFLMTASEAGNERLRALRDPIGFKKAIMEAKTERAIAINTARRPAPAPIAAPVAPAPAPVAPVPSPVAAPPHVAADEIARGIAALATLRDSGAITPEEYEAKKRELLARM